MDTKDVTLTSESKSETEVSVNTSATDSSDLVRHQPPAKGGDDLPKKTATATPNPTEAPSEETKQEEGEETLSQALEKGDKVTLQKVKYPKTTAEDLDVSGEQPEIRSQHTLDDLDKMFNVTGNGEWNPKLFHSIMKNDPDGAERMAQAMGWRSAHFAKAAIELFEKAKTDAERQKVLESDFPEVLWKEEAEVPFKVNITGKGTSNQIKTETKGILGYTSDSITRAVNDYVADNDNVSKEDILQSVKVKKLLEEFSGLHDKDGNQFSVNKALAMAVDAAGLKKEKLTKKVTSSIGGGTNIRKTSSEKKGLSEGARRIADLVGYKL